MNDTAITAEELSHLETQAQQGDSDAQYRLGHCYLVGNGVQRAAETALHWFSQAAETNHIEALLHLGYAYTPTHATLFQVEPNLETSLRYMEKLAELKLPAAMEECIISCKQLNLEEKMLHWANIGLEHNIPLAMFTIATHNIDSFSKEQRFTTDATGKSQLRPELGDSMELLEKSASQGLPDSQFYLAEFYRFHPQPNYEKALDYYHQAAAQTMKQAVLALADYYAALWEVMPENTQKDTEKAVEWMSRAAETGNINAMFYLYLAYLNGEGVLQSAEQAFQILQALAESKEPKALYEMATLYEGKSYLAADMKKSIYYLEQAANAGVAEAQYKFAMGLKAHIDKSQDNSYVEKMLDYFTASAKQNFIPSCAMLGNIFVIGGYGQSDEKTGLALLEFAAEKGDKNAIAFLENRKK